jgi:hypothetical protein
MVIVRLDRVAENSGFHVNTKLVQLDAALSEACLSGLIR